MGHQPVLCGIDANPVQPGIKGAVVAKARQRTIGPNETVLNNILHLGRITHHARNQTRELALVLGNQQAESLLVTRLHALDQYPVCFAITHGLCCLFSPDKKCGCCFDRKRV